MYIVVTLNVSQRVPNAKVLVEDVINVDHRIDRRYGRRVLAAGGFEEENTTVEHMRHCPHTRCLAASDILVGGSTKVEHHVHRRDTRRVPTCPNWQGLG